MICVVQFAHMGKKGRAYTVLVVRPEGKRTLGRLGCSWKDKIMVHLKKGIFGRTWFNTRKLAGSSNAVINFGFRNMQVIARLPEKLLASQEGRCFLESASWTSSTIFLKRSSVKLRENPFRGFLVITCRRTYQHGKANKLVFRNSSLWTLFIEGKYNVRNMTGL